MVNTQTEAWIGNDGNHARMYFDALGTKQLFISAPDIESVRKILLQEHKTHSTQSKEPVIYITRQTPLIHG